MSAVVKTAFKLSGMLDSSSPEPAAQQEYIHENEMMPTPDSAMENIPPPKKTARGQGKGKGRSKPNNANKVTKSKAAPRRRGSAGSVVTGTDTHNAVVEIPTKQKGTTTKKRSALGERVNVRQESCKVEVMGDVICEDSMMDADMDVMPDEEPISHDELDELVAETKKQGKTSRSKVQKDPIARIKAAAKGKKPVVQEETPDLVRQEDRQPKVGRGRVKKMTVSIDTRDDQEMIIAETQPSPVDMEDSVMDGRQEEEEEEEIQEELVPQQPVIRYSSRAPRSPSQSRQQITGGKKREVSVSETDRAATSGGSGDPILRRKLGEMTRKYENLESKHRDLRETGIKEAEMNFNKLKRQMEEKSKASEKLISSLQTSLSHQSNSIKEARSLEQKLISQTSEIEKLQSQISQLTSKLASTETSNRTLTNKVTSLETENKSLSSKLASISTTAANRNNNHHHPPSSSMKPSRPTPSSTTTADRTLLSTLQAKESLYSDLTGLIVPHIKSTPTSTIYDCIQTGRNGSLHFKLAITQPSSGNYEDTEFIFTPLLDQERDRSLIEILPDYLTEEITFARENAERFYLRVTEAVMKRR